MLLMATCLIMAMAASPAVAQSFATTPSDGSGDSLENACPAGQFAALPPNTPGEIGFRCFATQEAAENYSSTGQLPQTDDDMAGGGMADDGTADNPTTAPSEQYADDDMTELPSTGGPALLLPIAGVAMIALGGLFLKRRLS